MDKLESGKTITIKINGKNQPFIDEQKKKGHPHEYDPARLTPDVQGESEGYKEAAASQELAEESFDWILPEKEAGQPEIGIFKQVNTPSSKKNKLSVSFKSQNSQKKRAVNSILLTTIFAVMIGTSFGILMLKLVVSNQSKPAVVETNSPVNTTDNSPASSSDSVSLKSFTSYIVQEGVYSSKESANGISKLAMEKGLPAGVVETNGKYFLFLGIANSLDAARGLGNIYKEKGIGDPYPKALTVPEKKLSKLTEAEKMFIEKAPDYFSTLIKATSTAMAAGAVPADLQKASSAISDKHLKNKQLKSLAAALIGADEQLKEFQKSKDQQALVKSQQYLLTFLQLYSSL
ncbi:hypothetical protein ACF5W4_13365 [Bacillota bacterium Lsc_1132]